MPKPNLRRTLCGMKIRNRIEQTILPMDRELAKVARQLRTRFVDETPNATDPEIDARVARVLAAGSVPKKETTIPAKMQIPNEVLEARRAARRAEVNKGAKFRKG
jgi:hypothetical protein